MVIDKWDDRWWVSIDGMMIDDGWQLLIDGTMIDGWDDDVRWWDDVRLILHRLEQTDFNN